MRYANGKGWLITAKVEKLGSAVVASRIAPDDAALIRQAAQELLAAGADLILTNSFGGSPHKLAAYGLALLLLNGAPLNEPIVGHGPFVMNTQEEIVQAINDYNSGRFGQIGR